jgi:hypothetical protein
MSLSPYQYLQWSVPTVPGGMLIAVTADDGGAGDPGTVDAANYPA